MVRHALRRSGTALVAAAALVAPLGVAVASGAVGATATDEPTLGTVADTSVWGANGRVMSIVSLPGDRVAVGGGFSYLGPSTGHSAVVTGTGAPASGAAMVNGEVNAVVPDGTGGYYVGGTFTQAAGVARKGVAHIKANGALDRAFRADVNGSVLALAMQGNLLLVGGSFSQVNGTGRANLAAVDVTTGAVSSSLNGANGRVNALVSDSAGRVLVGGSFTSLLGQTRYRVARVNTDTSLDGGFGAGVDGEVRTLATSPDGATVYAGGDFSWAGGPGGWAQRQRLAAWDAASAGLQSWAPAVAGNITDMSAHASGTVFVAGSFTTLGGQARQGAGAVGPDGAVTPWDPQLTGCQEPHTTKDVYTQPACTTAASAVAVAGDTVYLGGNFLASNGTPRHDLAAYDTYSGALTSWNPAAGAKVNAISVVGTGDTASIFMGGQFTSVGGVERRGVAVLDMATGQVDPNFTADVNGMVLDLEKSLDGSSLYVAGSFDTVNGTTRSNAAKVSAATGAVVQGFNPSFNGTTIVAAVAGDNVWFGGKFTKVSRLVRQHVAKVSGTSGQVDPTWVANTWGPSGKLRANGMVQGLEVAPDGSKVYLAGPFNTINNVSVAGGIAVRSGDTGVQVGTLGGVQGCSSVGPWINRLYLSPDGQRLYGGDVCPDYIYQWDAVGLATPSRPTGILWRAWCNAGMQGALEVNGRFYYGSHGGNRGSGGACSEMPGGYSVERSRLAVFAQSNGYLLNYTTLLDTPMGVWSFAPTSRGLLMGGDFTIVGDRAVIQQSLALLPGTP